MGFAVKKHILFLILCGLLAQEQTVVAMDRNTALDTLFSCITTIMPCCATNIDDNEYAPLPEHNHEENDVATVASQEEESEINEPVEGVSEANGTEERSYNNRLLTTLRKNTQKIIKTLLCCKHPSRLQDFDPNNFKLILNIDINDKTDEQTDQLLHITDIWLTWILPYADQNTLLALRATCRRFEVYVFLFANRRHPNNDNLSFEPNPEGIEFAITRAVQNWAELGAFCASFPFMISIAGGLINVRYNRLSIQEGLQEIVLPTKGRCVTAMPVLQKETFQKLLKNRRHLDSVQTQLCNLGYGKWLLRFIPEEHLFNFINLRSLNLGNVIFTGGNIRHHLEVKHLPQILTTHKHIRKIGILFDEPSYFVEECPAYPLMAHANISICKDARPNQAFIVQHIIRIFPNITNLYPPQSLLNEDSIKNETLSTIIFGLTRLKHLELGLLINAITYLATLQDRQHENVETVTFNTLAQFIPEVPNPTDIALSLQHVFPNLKKVSVKVCQPDSTTLVNTHTVEDAPQTEEEQGEEEECEGEETDDEDSEEEIVE